jgi:outer membrane receptor protein involved in Fe transport
MNTTPSSLLRPLTVCALLALAGVARSGAQSPPPPPPDAAVRDQVIKIDPFEVQADSDRGYGATNSNSITNFNTALDRLPISADIFDQRFLSDVKPISVEDLIQTYSAGAGYSTSGPGGSAASTQPLDRNGTSYIQLRGLSSPSQMRDGYMVLGTLDNPGSTGVGYSSTYDLERVEIINGPQALLYGFGGGGGVINMVSKQARLGQPAFGSVTFQLDQYGNKQGLFDYGVGTERFAVRAAVVEQTVGGRRQWVGGPLHGDYIQFAGKVGNTVIRAQAEESTFNRTTSNGVSLSAASTSNDARNGQAIHYLLATNQIDSAKMGNQASGAGVIDNGYFNWGNVDSYEGRWGADLSVIDFYEVNADSQWNSWFSTKVSAGWSYSDEDRVNDSFSLYAPNSTSNPIQGHWTMAMNGGTPAGDQDKPTQNRVFRVSGLITNDLFGGKAHSQTNFGIDNFRSDTGQQSYGYYLADSNFNPVITPGNSNQGRTVVPTVGWTVDNGPVQYALWAPRAKTVTYNGQNYVRMIINQVDPTKISPADPLGVSVIGGGNYTVEKVFEKGIFGVNYTQWMDGKLDTLVGFRYNQSKDLRQYAGASSLGPAFLGTVANTLSFNVGVDYKLTDWLRPYASVSSSSEPALEQATDPYGKPTSNAKAFGQEFGFKLSNKKGDFSGSIAIYHVKSANEETSITSNLLNDINPSGLNGRFGAPSVWIDVAREAQGVQAQFTSTPTRNLRVRASAAYTDGTIGTSTSYKQFYNDQFYADKNGNVTYADGTIVYVPATFNSKNPTLTVDPASPGAIPLTIASMNDSANAYFANPVAINGQISSGSNAAKVLLTSNPLTAAHGSILTGATGLPISAIQINPGFVPPGTVPTSVAGEATTNYPELAANLTAIYTFDDSFLKGFRLGGSMQVGWFNRDYYYYPQGPGVGAPRLLYNTPTNTRVDLVTGYTHRFRRVTFDTQLNVNNLLNHYDVIITANEITGYAGPNNATFTQQPRTFTWTNTLSF